MNENISIAIIATIVPSIASIAAVLVALINSKKSDRVNEKADTLIQKSDVIHQLTNSQLSNLTQALAVANKEIEGLKKLIASMIVNKDLEIKQNEMRSNE